VNIFTIKIIRELNLFNGNEDMNKTFPDEVKRDVSEAQNDFCLEKGCYEPIHSHHHKLLNTDYNRKKFLYLFYSPFNCAGLLLQRSY